MSREQSNVRQDGRGSFKMKVKNLTYKNMVESYKEARADMNSVWDAFLTLRYMGYISEDTWLRFFNTCRSWDYNSELAQVIDADTGDVIRYF